MYHQPVPKPRLRISQVSFRRSDGEQLRGGKRAVKLPYIATIRIFLSKGLGQFESVVLVRERCKFFNIFVTSTGGRQVNYESA